MCACVCVYVWQFHAFPRTTVKIRRPTRIGGIGARCCRGGLLDSNLPATDTTIDTPISRLRFSYAPVPADVYGRRSRRLTAVNLSFGSPVSHRIGSREPSQVIPRLSQSQLRLSLPAHVASFRFFSLFFRLSLCFFVSLANLVFSLFVFLEKFSRFLFLSLFLRRESYETVA